MNIDEGEDILPRTEDLEVYSYFYRIIFIPKETSTKELRDLTEGTVLREVKYQDENFIL